jgi:hypothetical protein
MQLLQRQRRGSVSPEVQGQHGQLNEILLQKLKLTINLFLNLICGVNEGFFFHRTKIFLYFYDNLKVNNILVMHIHKQVLACVPYPLLKLWSSLEIGLLSSLRQY